MQKSFKQFVENLNLSTKTFPYTISHSSSIFNGDESSTHQLILNENEHFINQYNLSQSQDSDNDDAYDLLNELTQSAHINTLAELIAKEHNINFTQTSLKLH